LSKRFDEAYRVASRLHRGRVKKDLDVPEIAHLLGTASLALEYGASEDEAIAAILHDAVEARGTSARREILLRFGAGVAAIVDGCTDAGSEKIPWCRRKAAYTARLASADAGTRQVAICDKLENVRRLTQAYRTLGESLWKKLGPRSRADRLWYYRALVAAFRSSGGGPAVEELARSVAELEVLVKTRKTRAPAS
jgi:(p)ppGpp synthase/HD superfamily hydrolase